MERRLFLGALAGAIDGRWMQMTPFAKQKPGQESGMPHRTLGKTGESVSCIGLGGFHLGLSRLEEPDAIKLFQAARTFSSVSTADIAPILARTKPAAEDGRFEPFKTSVMIFDSTAAHPEWLGYNPRA